MMSKTISKYTERFLFNTKVRKGDFDWNLLNMSYELTDEQEALRQLNGLIESIVTNNNTYTAESFKSDVEQAAEEVNNG
jgi:hypothetical protein|tara:strand:- start:54 stop:290 length:237 start_codon:yes stop_codon:yes gene_type:complete